MNKSRNKIKIFFLFFLFLTITAIFVFLQKNKKPVVEQAVQNEKHIIPPRPQTFEDSSKNLLETIKQARVAAYRFDATQAKFYINESLILWRDTVNEFINTPPKDYDPDEWINSVTKIYETIQSAEKKININDYTGTIDDLDDCRNLLDNVYSVEKNNPEQHRLFPLLLLIKNIVDTKNLDEAKPILNEIKINYTLFKELPKSQMSEERIKKFESAISEIENATPVMFPLAIENIEPAFFDIYIMY